MIRTNYVKLTTLKAIAYRQKLGAGDTGLTILRPDVKQPGMATLSKTSNDPIPARNTPLDLYPMEAFKEAAELTLGYPYRKQGNVKVTEEMFREPEIEEEVAVEEEVVIDSKEYQKLLDKYTDSKGKFSYALFNKDLIQFAHRSTIVRKMISDGKPVKEISAYIADNKIRNITGNDDLSDAQVQKILALLDEVSPKGVLKDLNDEIRKQLTKAK